MDFKSRFKTKISHITKDGIVGVIAQNSQPVTKFKVSNTNLHYMIFTKKHPDPEKIKLDFSASPGINSQPVSFRNPNDPLKIFKERSSDQLKFRVNYQQNNLKNVRSANDTPITSLSPVDQDLKENKGVVLPFLPALNKNEISQRRVGLPMISPPKYKKPQDSPKQSLNNTTIITNSPLFSNKIAISVKKEDGYQRKWMKNRNQPKDQTLINAAEKNLVGEERGKLNEFIESQESKNSLGVKNTRENQKNLKTLEVEISKVLNKLNEISESIKSPLNYN